VYEYTIGATPVASTTAWQNAFTHVDTCVFVSVVDCSTSTTGRRYPVVM